MMISVLKQWKDSLFRGPLAINPYVQENVVIPDDSYIAWTTRELFVYRTRTHPGLAPENYYVILPEYTKYESYPMGVMRSNIVHTPLGVAEKITAIYLVVSDDPFVVRNRKAVMDDNWGTDQRAYEEEEIESMTLDEFNLIFTGLFP